MTYGRIEESLRVLLSPAAADGSACPTSDFYRYAAGEATPDEARAFEVHRASCRDCQSDLAVFRGGPLARAPHAAFSNAWRFLALGWRLAPALAAVLVVVGLGVWRIHGLEESTEGELRVKGGYRLHVAVESGTERFIATSGDSVQPGDVLGFFYSAPRPTHLVLLAADERGEVSPAYATSKENRLAAGAELRLAAGAVVEEGGSCEWLFAFFSPSPIDIASLREPVRQSVRAAAAGCVHPHLVVPGMTIDALVLKKRKP